MSRAGSKDTVSKLQTAVFKLQNGISKLPNDEFKLVLR
jgi:hypothetical protein